MIDCVSKGVSLLIFRVAMILQEAGSTMLPKGRVLCSERLPLEGTVSDISQLSFGHSKIVASSCITVRRISSRISSSLEQTASMFFW